MLKNVNMMDVSIIMVNYKTVSILCDAIDSIIKQTSDISYEIIVVDNNSEDNSQSVLLDRYSDRVRYIGLLENIGFGRANNEGIKRAQGRNILFLNPDTLLCNNAIKFLCDYLDTHKDVGVVGGNLFSKEGVPTISFSRTLPSIWSELNYNFLQNIPYKIFYGRNINFNSTNSPLDVGYISGADMMVPMRILKKIGFFDPDFFMYYEETELTYRIRQKKYKVRNIPQAKIIHLEGQSFKVKESREYQFFRGRHIYYRKTTNEYLHRIIDCLYLSALNIRYIIWSILQNNEKKQNINMYKGLFFRVKAEMRYKN